MQRGGVYLHLFPVMIGQYSDPHFSHFHSMPFWHQVSPTFLPTGQAAETESEISMARSGKADFSDRLNFILLPSLLFALASVACLRYYGSEHPSG